ncbi:MULTISPECIES: sensor histidine kinase [unclassified Nocardioides]|uniref:sensor histidine kinase n=1 Tax=unclassified Nocardioides TaxID=2615069 RepID=UPI003014C495
MLDIGLAFLVLAATWVSVENETFVLVPPSTWGECLILVTATAVLVASRVPFAALTVTAVLDALPYWLAIGGAGYHLGLMITVYMVVARAAPRRALPAVGGVLAAQVCLMAWDMDWRWSSVYVVVAAVTVVVPVTLGLASHSRRLATLALRERALAAEESRDADARKLLAEDRLRTARDLHDTVAHQIAVMNLNAGVASHALQDRPEDAELALVTVREAGRAVISSISDLLTGLRDGQLDDPDPPYPLTDLRLLVDEFERLLPGLAASIDVQDRGSSPTVSPVVFSVVQEALTNVYKHGRHDAEIRLHVELQAEVSRVEAINIPTSSALSVTEGFGLRGMRERVVGAGGLLSAVVAQGRFTLTAEVPSGGGGR